MEARRLLWAAVAFAPFAPTTAQPPHVACVNLGFQYQDSPLNDYDLGGSFLRYIDVSAAGGTQTNPDSFSSIEDCCTACAGLRVSLPRTPLCSATS